MGASSVRLPSPPPEPYSVTQGPSVPLVTVGSGGPRNPVGPCLTSRKSPRCLGSGRGFQIRGSKLFVHPSGTGNTSPPKGFSVPYLGGRPTSPLFSTTLCSIPMYRPLPVLHSPGVGRLLVVTDSSGPDTGGWRMTGDPPGPKLRSSPKLSVPEGLVRPGYGHRGSPGRIDGYSPLHNV